MEQCKGIDERCKGYQDELINIVGEILEYERQHRIKGIRIQQKINDKCDATGRFLAENIGKEK